MQAKFATLLSATLMLGACCASNPPKEHQISAVSAETLTVPAQHVELRATAAPAHHAASAAAAHAACTPPFAHPGDTATFDDECGDEGTPEQNDFDARAAEYTQKNNLCADTSSPMPLSFADFKKLQRDIPDDVSTGDSNTSVQDRTELRGLALSNQRTASEGQVVRLVGLATVKMSKSNEGVNCHKTAEAKTDIHINLSPDGVECNGIIVEIIPHSRPEHWRHIDTYNKLNQSIVRVTGQLFLDSRHSVEPRTGNTCPSPPRVSLWEIHPVYAIDICRNGSLSGCKADNESVWSEFAQ